MNNTLDGDNQTLKSNDQLTFRFDILYSKFLEEGKVFIDGEEVDSSNYTSKEGSTIITFNSNYVKNLSNGEHTVKVTVRDGEANAKFNVTDNQQGIINSTSNPDTGDNIMFYISLLGISLAGLLGFGIYTKKRYR